MTSTIHFPNNSPFPSWHPLCWRGRRRNQGFQWSSVLCPVRSTHAVEIDLHDRMKGKNCFYSDFSNEKWDSSNGWGVGGWAWGWRGESQNVDFVVCWVCALNHRGTQAKRAGIHKKQQPSSAPTQAAPASSYLRQGTLGNTHISFISLDLSKWISTHFLAPLAPDLWPIILS